MTFSDTYQLLSWYFRRKWLRPPRETGNHDMFFYQRGYKCEECEEIFNTCLKIVHVLCNLSDREYYLISLLFEGQPICDIRKFLRCSWRTIRRERARMLDQLDEKFERVGMIKHIFEPPVYFHEGEEG